MASFWGDQAVYAGPYGRPARPGVFDRITQGMDAIAGLGNLYTRWQSQSQAQKERALQGVATQIGMAKTINPDQPIVPTEAMVAQAKKGGFDWPTVTPETREGMAGALMPPAIPSTAGDKVTSPASSAQVARNAAQVQGMAALSAVGGPMPIQPTPSIERMKMAALRGMSPEQQKSALFPKAETGYVYDQATNSFRAAPGPGHVAVVRQPPQKESYDEWLQKQTVKDDNAMNRVKYKHQLEEGSPKNQNFYVDKDGNVVRMGRGKFHYEGKGGKEDTDTVTTTTPTDPMNPFGGSTRVTKKVPRGTTSGGGQPAGQQYMLPKNGQMVPVDKETYDAYQKKYGQQ